jgi:hypothetical protein
MTETKAGRFYGRDRRGTLHDLGEAPVVDRAVDAWICRRVADFPGGRAPDGAGVASCARCGVALAFNPQRTLDAPKVCMQCSDIQPDPIAG